MNHVKSEQVHFSTMRKIELSRILDTAVEDGINGFVEKKDNQYSINKEQAIESFFQTLYVNLNVQTDDKKEMVRNYIPAVVALDQDGYWICHQVLREDEYGGMVSDFIWSPKKYFSYSDENYQYAFTLTDWMTILDFSTGTVIEGNWEDLRETLIDTPLNDYEAYRLLKQEVITKNIKEELERVINAHNDIAIRQGIRYHFFMPAIEMDTWNRGIDQVAFFAFLQGLPIGAGGDVVNIYSFGGAHISKNRVYYGVEAPNGEKIYHIEECNNLSLSDKENSIEFDSREAAALEGYRPCEECKP